MIHQGATQRGLGFVRVWVFCLWLLHVLPDSPHLLARLPRESFSPHGVLRLIPDAAWDWILTEPVLLGLKWALVAGLALCALGVRPWRAVALPTIALLTIHQGLARGYFYMNHQELSALYAAYVFALLPPSGFSWFRPEDEPERAPDPSARLVMVLLALLVLTPYCLIAAHRLSHNGLGIWSSGALPYWIADNSYGPTWYRLTPVAEAVLQRPLLVKLLEVGFPVVTVMELLAPVCLVQRRFRQGWILVMAGFHLSTMFLMDIFFWEVLLLYPVLLVDGEPLLRWLDRWRGSAPQAGEAEAGSRAGAEPDPPS